MTLGAWQKSVGEGGDDNTSKGEKAVTCEKEQLWDKTWIESSSSRRVGGEDVAIVGIKMSLTRKHWVLILTR